MSFAKYWTKLFTHITKFVSQFNVLFYFLNSESISAWKKRWVSKSENIIVVWNVRWILYHMRRSQSPTWKKYHARNTLIIFFAESDPCDGYTCHEYAKCYNRGGNAVCVCNDGYVGSGKYCKSKLLWSLKLFWCIQQKFLLWFLPASNVFLLLFPLFFLKKLALI